MGKKTAEEILYKNFFNVVGEPANDNEWQEIKQHPMHKATVTAMEQYSSLQSEEKDKEIKLVQSIMAQQLIEIERLREALKGLEYLFVGREDWPEIQRAQAALSNQPIESDIEGLRLRQNHIITILDKDRRIKELEDLISNGEAWLSMNTHPSPEEINSFRLSLKKALNP